MEYVLNNFKEESNELYKLNIDKILNLYERVTVYVYKCFESNNSNLAYQAQDLQEILQDEIKNRIKF